MNAEVTRRALLTFVSKNCVIKYGMRFPYNTRLLTTYTYFIGLMNLDELRWGWLAIFSITWRAFALPSPYNPSIPAPTPFLSLD